MIEIIASLMLLAIVTAVLGLGLVRAMEIFDFTRGNVQIAQKGQMAMARIARELMELTNIADNQVPGEDPFIIYERVSNSPSELRKAIHYHPEDQRIRLYIGLDPSDATLDAGTISQGYVLVDGVSAFSLGYFQGTENWTIGSDLNLLSTIRINLSLERPDKPGRTQDFTTLVHMRNTGNMGGAAPSLTPASANNYSCFIQSIREPAMPHLASSTAIHHLAAVKKNIPTLIIAFQVTCCLALIGWLPAVIKSRHVRRKGSDDFTNIHGSALVLIITALLIFAIITASILPMVSSSGQQSAAADWSAKAYLLAESGFRYAASRYLNAGPLNSQKNDALENLDGTYTLKNNDGEFALEVYSYFLTVETITGNQFKAHCPGSFPPPPDSMSILPGLKLRIGNEETPFEIIGTSPATGEEDDKLIITVDRELATSITQSTLVRPVADAAGNMESISNGGILAYEQDDADMFPLRNGNIEVGNRILTYSLRDSNGFMDVRDPKDHGMSLTVADGEPITLVPHILLHATGRYGSGVQQANRLVIYHAPLPFSSTNTRRVSFSDRFETSDNWNPVLGQHESAPPQNSDTNNALLVQESATLGAEDRISLAQFHPAGSGIDFRSASSTARGYLNYDTQVKIGFYNNPQIIPLYGFKDSTSYIPNYHTGGLSFRLSGQPGSLNMYGVSLLRANSNLSDAIADEIVPPSMSDKQVIVLWRQTANGTNRQWLAYRNIDPDPVNTDFGESGWSGDWTLYEEPAEPDCDSPPCYGIDSTQSISGQLIYEGNLPDSDRISLKFLSKFQSRKNNDDSYVEICHLAKNGPICTNIYTPEVGVEWRSGNIPLCQFSGKQVQIVFHFQSSQGFTASWYIDDVKIEADWPLEDSTLLVRVVEAAALVFDSGGPQAVVSGDWVQGQSSGARGQVIQPPILSIADWTNSNAQGLLLLNRVSQNVDFQAEQLKVIGKDSTLTVSAFNPLTDKQVNFIRVYYTRTNGCTAPDATPLANTNPFDAIKHGSPRISGDQENLPWPPDEGDILTPENDYFRLIQWDAINDDPTISYLSIVNSTDQPRAIIRNYHEDLQSPDIFQDHAELGLHSLGDGAANVYFDDFGIQIDVSPDPIFPLPLQQ